MIKILPNSNYNLGSDPSVQSIRTGTASANDYQIAANNALIINDLISRRLLDQTGSDAKEISELIAKQLSELSNISNINGFMIG